MIVLLFDCGYGCRFFKMDAASLNMRAAQGYITADGVLSLQQEFGEHNVGE